MLHTATRSPQSQPTAHQSRSVNYYGQHQHQQQQQQQKSSVVTASLGSAVFAAFSSGISSERDENAADARAAVSEMPMLNADEELEAGNKEQQQRYQWSSLEASIGQVSPKTERGGFGLEFDARIWYVTD